MVRTLFIIPVTLFTVFLGVSFANETELDNFFSELKKASNIKVAKIYERKIWKFWLSGGSSDEENKKMNKGVILMKQGKFENSLKIFVELTSLNPQWAEAWNKRATIKYFLGDFYGSIIDIQHTLLIEPRHFGALSGLTQINFYLGRYNDALNSLCYLKY